VIVVTDTSVILNLCFLGQESLVTTLFGTVCAPPGVQQEFQRLANEDERFQGLVFPPFIEVRSPVIAVVAVMENQRLHEGERAALCLALELNADAVLMDERAGRTAASTLGLSSIGLLGILLQARKQQLIPAIRPLLDRLQSHARFWISPSLLQQILQAANE